MNQKIICLFRTTILCYLISFLLIATHSNYASNYEMCFLKANDMHAVYWGSTDDLKAGSDYTMKIYLQSGTGERPTLWEGKLIVE